MTSATLKGKIALITGSTSGIGLSMARMLGRHGASVVINGLGDAEDIERARTTIGENGADCLYHNADLRDEKQIDAMIDTALARFGRVDILVNNAGIQHVAPVDKLPPSAWHDITAICLSSAFFTIRRLLPSMREHGFGRIVNVASVHGLVASPYKSAYVAAKHGMIGLTKCVALETAEQAITCNAICPGYVRTALVEKQIESQARLHHVTKEAAIRDVMLATQPTKRFVEFAALDAMLLFLCSDAGASATGASFTLDGGWTAR